jgi:Asp-tRNA(Asn)/Glu-tRNA(Gln) amidotransferase A subunit family amidase
MKRIADYETLHALEAQARAWNKTTNAFIAHTSAADLKIAFDATEVSAPLHGVTFAVKDNIWVAGAATSIGYKPALFEVASKDATFVQRIRNAGAILVGRTNLDELCLDYIGKNRFYGDIQNPIYPALLMGGSSGGSAAAVAAGYAEFAIGTDIGGSLRMPAAACGCIGIKFGSNTIDRSGLMSIAPTLDAYGVFTKTIADAEFLLQALELIPATAAREPLSIIIPALDETPFDREELRTHYHQFLQQSFETLEISPRTVPLKFRAAKDVRTVIAVKEIADFFDAHPIIKENPLPQAQAILRMRERLTDKKIAEAYNAKQAIADYFHALGEKSVFITPLFPDRIWSWQEANAILNGESRGNLAYYLALANIADLVTVTLPIIPDLKGYPPFPIQIMAHPANLAGVLLTAKRLLESAGTH